MNQIHDSYECIINIEKGKIEWVIWISEEKRGVWRILEWFSRRLFINWLIKVFVSLHINDFEYDPEHDNEIKLNFHVERDAGPEVDFIIIENETRIASNLEYVTNESATIIPSLSLSPVTRKNQIHFDKLFRWYFRCCASACNILVYIVTLGTEIITCSINRLWRLHAKQY